MPQTHVVRRGETPAKIAIAHVGCPKCARDLVPANPHKPAVVHPNGFVTFKDLREGEEIKLPAKWFNGDLDRRPPAYFAALPHHDGRTPGKLGLSGAGVLGDYAALDAATANVAALAAMDDLSFSMAAPGASATIDQSVHEADGSVNPGISAYAQATHIATKWANDRNADLIQALNANNQSAVTVARQSVQTALSTALDSAQLALQAVYGAPATGGVNIDIGSAKIDAPALVAAAQAVVATISSSPDFCNLVAQPGSAVNAAVHAFKLAWNTANPATPVPIDTGNYEQATASVLTQILGSAPPACGAKAAPAPTQPGGVTPPLLAQTPAPSTGLSTGSILGIGLIGVGVVGGAIFLATRKAEPPRMRESRHRSFKYTDNDEDEEASP